MVNIVANILLVREHLMDGASGPRTSKVCEHPPDIKRMGNFRFAFSLANERLIDPLHNFYLLFRSRNQDHSVSLQTLLLPHFED